MNQKPQSGTRLWLVTAEVSVGVPNRGQIDHVLKLRLQRLLVVPLGVSEAEVRRAAFTVLERGVQSRRAAGGPSVALELLHCTPVNNLAQLATDGLALGSVGLDNLPATLHVEILPADPDDDNDTPPRNVSLTFPCSSLAYEAMTLVYTSQEVGGRVGADVEHADVVACSDNPADAVEAVSRIIREMDAATEG